MALSWSRLGRSELPSESIRGGRQDRNVRAEKIYFTTDLWTFSVLTILYLKPGWEGKCGYLALTSISPPNDISANLHRNPMNSSCYKEMCQLISLDFPFSLINQFRNAFPSLRESREVERERTSVANGLR